MQVRIFIVCFNGIGSIRIGGINPAWMHTEKFGCSFDTYSIKPTNEFNNAHLFNHTVVFNNIIHSISLHKHRPPGIYYTEHMFYCKDPYEISYNFIFDMIALSRKNRQLKIDIKYSAKYITRRGSLCESDYKRIVIKIY